MSTAKTKKNTKKTTELPADAPLNGSDIFVEAMIRNGMDHIFAYPGGASMPLHQSLRKYRDKVRTILPRHEQGGTFAAQGISRATDAVGVCMGTSGPGATNLVTGIADAKLDSCPMIAISGQVPQAVIGSDAFQETPMVELCRPITKHHYMICADDWQDAESVQKALRDIPRIVKEAYYIAKTGRPGPVLIDYPKNMQLAVLDPAYDESLGELDWDPELGLPGYRPERRVPKAEQVSRVIAAIKRAKKPILYVGGGCINAGASEDLTAFARKAGIPVTMTAMGLGSFPGTDPLSLHMLGMHGTVYSNKAINDADLLLAFGVRFDDRVTGKLTEFAKHGKIVHVDIDPSEMHKNKEAHIPVVANLKLFLEQLNEAFTDDDIPDCAEWRDQCAAWKKEFPLSYADPAPHLNQQYAIDTLWQMTKDVDTYVATGVGQHQMWAAQFYKFDEPKRWLSSLGLGTMGFGLPCAMGVATVKPDSLVVNIEGDGSFQMNIQELATLRCENIHAKTLLLNNQHLGMVTQWEDRFMDGRRAHTYLGPVDHPEWLGDGDGSQYQETYPNFAKIAEGYGVASAQVRTKAEYPAALKKMIEHDGPYVLDVICNYQEHVLPMIPAGGTVRDIITE